MSTCDSDPPCTLPCPWEGTSFCLRRVLGERVSAQQTLSHGHLAALHYLYYPHNLPPCVTVHGCLHYHPLTTEEEVRVLAEVERDDSPGL